MENEETNFQNSISNVRDQQSPAPLVPSTAELPASSPRRLTVRTHVSGTLATIPGTSPTSPRRDDSCWGWLEPAPECSSRNLLPHVMLRGSVIGIGRGTDAFDLVPEVLQSATAGACTLKTKTTAKTAAAARASPQTARAPGGTEVMFETGRSASSQIPGLFVEIPDGRVSRAHCLISTTATATTAPSTSMSSSSPILRDISRNGTFLNGRKLSRGEEAPLSDGDRISLVLSVAPLSEQALIFHLGHPLAALLEGPPPTQWIGWKGPSFSEREDTQLVTVAGLGEESISSPASPASLASPSPKSFPPPPQRRASSASSSAPPSSHSPSPSPSPSLPCVSVGHTTAMKRSATSLYTTPEAALAEPSTLHCQICLDTMTNAVALEPCGHSYCATCLSQHFGACLQHDQALACPLRCSLPQRVVVNTVVRQLVEELQQQQQKEHNNNNPEIEYSNNNTLETMSTPSAAATMHPISSLEDSHLPLSLSSLKDEKLISILHSISQATTDNNNTKAVDAFELLAKLAWSDDEARKVVCTHSGVAVVLEGLDKFMYNEATLCSGCLALMALIRNGDGPGSSANRWQLGMRGGVEILVKAMNRHKNLAMVQLSALLCLVAVALEGTYFQVKISQIGTKTILSAIKRHIDCEEVVAKGLLAIGALVKGDCIADQLAAAGVIEVITAVLRRYGGTSEDVLWSSMFVLAVLARRNELPGSSGSEELEYDNKNYIERLLRMASAGILNPLLRAVDEYRINYDVDTTNSTTVDGSNGGGGGASGTGQEAEMIVAAAEFLEEALKRASAILWLRRVRRMSQAAIAGVLLWMGYKSYRKVRGKSTTTTTTTTRGRSTGTNISSLPRRHFPWFI